MSAHNAELMTSLQKFSNDLLNAMIQHLDTPELLSTLSTGVVLVDKDNKWSPTCLASALENLCFLTEYYIDLEKFFKLAPLMKNTFFNSLVENLLPSARQYIGYEEGYLTFGGPFFLSEGADHFQTIAAIFNISGLLSMEIHQKMNQEISTQIGELLKQDTLEHVSQGKSSFFKPHGSSYPPRREIAFQTAILMFTRKEKCPPFFIFNNWRYAGPVPPLRSIDEEFIISRQHSLDWHNSLEAKMGSAELTHSNKPYKSYQKACKKMDYAKLRSSIYAIVENVWSSTIQSIPHEKAEAPIHPTP